MLLDARFFVWLMRNGGAALARTQEAWHNEYALSSIWCRAAQHYLQLRLLNRTDGERLDQLELPVESSQLKLRVQVGGNKAIEGGKVTLPQLRLDSAFFYRVRASG